jgi:hypothetical protein
MSDAPLPSDSPSADDLPPTDNLPPSDNPPADSPPSDNPPADNPPSGEIKDAWGDDWRQSYAGEDEKMVKRLERYSSPKAAIDALVAAQNKISSGELKTALQPDSSDEEKTQWRTDNGIPDSADGYELDLPNGIVVGEEDKPMVDSFLESAHDSNMHPDQVNKALGWYYDHQDKLMEQQEISDAEGKQAGEDKLRVEWGTDYRRNIQIVNNLMDSAPEGLKDQIMGARLSDGTPLGNDPSALNWLNELSRQINPVATVVPGSGTNAVQAIESELSSLKSMMGDRTSEYWKGDKAAKNQERYRELIGVMEKHG